MKADVVDITRICHVQHPRAVRFLRRWACERLAILADEVLRSRAAAALKQWGRTVAAMIMSERKGAYLRYQGSKKMEFALEKALLRRLAKAWIRWTSLVKILREEEHRACENGAAIIVQRAVRGWIARRYLSCLKYETQERRRYHAATIITSCIKGKVARMRYERMKANIVRMRAVERIIRVGRGMLRRTRANRLCHDKARSKVSKKNLDFTEKECGSPFSVFKKIHLGDEVAYMAHQNAIAHAQM